MNRFDWMMLKACLPVAFGLAASFLVLSLGSQFVGHEYLGQIGRFLILASGGLFSTSVGYAIWIGVRLWRWDRGRGLICHRCDGLLGYERAGRPSRGGRYRKCLACGDNANHRYYD